MTPQEKTTIYQKAAAHVAHIRTRITAELTTLHTKVSRKKRELASLTGADHIVEAALVSYHYKRIEECNVLYPTPYFFRCDFVNAAGVARSIYLAKFPLIEEAIYSWVTPFASIRFEKPGVVSYTKPGGATETVTLLRKEQFMIVDGAIKFLATEAFDAPRELVYQEHFSNRKTGFVLPEIVAQMEKAQDQVIRADYHGSLVISGPAGSGKTTLALHRVAYLAQAPDTAALFPGRSTLVFVQDAGTKAYFSHLLPELGIHDVMITTFAEWALNVLDVHGFTYTQQFGTDKYEWQKLQALRDTTLPKYSKQPFSLLEKIYTPVFDPDEWALFKKQTAARVLDRVDVTLLLRAYVATHDALAITKEYYVQHKNNQLTKKTGRFPIEYALIVIDEFQNYLADQLTLIKKCVIKESQAVLYVGDMAQQIYFGTIRDWKEIDETISPERQVLLQKVYRNTREILAYIQSRGYAITIPPEVKNGRPVQEKICMTPTEEIAYVESLVAEADDQTIGVLAPTAEYLAPFKKTFAKNTGVHLLTMAEAQGVEFDVVCLVGQSVDSVPQEDENTQFARAKIRTQKDLLYVALTRAISELHVLGNQPGGRH